MSGNPDPRRLHLPPPGPRAASGPGGDDDRRAQWGDPATREPRWPATAAVLAAIALQLVLPTRLLLGPRWLVPTLEATLALALLVASPYRLGPESRLLRTLSVGLIALVNAANVLSLAFLIHDLLYGSTGGRELVMASVPVWLTNVVVFGLWFWELDRGGPPARLHPGHRAPDFLFPQMGAPGSVAGSWSPRFSDYLYTSFTNATAFSPTDTMPLTPWAKALMSAQALASLVTVALVVSRAVNILG